MKKILAWPAPLLQKWLLSLLLCLPFLAAAIVSAFSGDRTFLILSALLLLFCGVRCADNKQPASCLYRNHRLNQYQSQKAKPSA